MSSSISGQWPKQTLGVEFLSDYIVKIGRYFCITIATAALILPIIVLLVGLGRRLECMME